MQELKTNYGLLSGVVDLKTYDDGNPKSCILNCENRIQTPVGEMIPQYRVGEVGERQKKYRSSLSFFKNGQLKSAALDIQMPIQTPLRTVRAELVTFYESGEMNRVFPLNGKIDAYWNEIQEREMAETMEFDLKVGHFKTKIMCVHFYPGGAIKSLTLWPDEKITLNTPLGQILCRTGFSLYENGELKSIEPSRPAKIATPIGDIYAFDSEIIGLHGDQNSVTFTVDGSLSSLKTVHNGFIINHDDGSREMIEPIELPSLIHENEMRTVPLKLDFDGAKLSIEIYGDNVRTFDLSSVSISTYRLASPVKSGCSGCSGCSDNTGNCCVGK